MSLKKLVLFGLLIVAVAWMAQSAPTSTPGNGQGVQKNYFCNKTDASDKPDPSSQQAESADDEDDDDDENYDDGNDDEDDEDDEDEQEGNDDDDDADDDDDEDDDTQVATTTPAPIKKRPARKTPDDVGHMNIFIREPSKEGAKKKPKRFRFPVARYQPNKFPLTGPFVSYAPWLPIFADRPTKQTVIYSSTGGIYIIPPVVNHYGKLYSVAELLASGYASLVSTGAPPKPAVNVAPLVQPGAVTGPGVPSINPTTGSFSGGVNTQYGWFLMFKNPTKIYGPLSPSYQMRNPN